MTKRKLCWTKGKLEVTPFSSFSAISILSITMKNAEGWFPLTTLLVCGRSHGIRLHSSPSSSAGGCQVLASRPYLGADWALYVYL